ncbi:carbohydrate ABC transporter permease [Sulfobacillus harzensis]|uniref:Sugar ABC transporter permease n=1 Tax=Sulfobacillus harzensis TaxID=2729629 RepID=A0A7Y0L6L0_9FIRM|nr:sugar ABC transporter permease [Sulfobacillus harzensis]NMP22869.1 sugar ABC transporter permease [Sulfobacillus harzensis]
MSTIEPSAAVEPGLEKPVKRRRRLSRDKAWAVITLIPTLILLGVFVYAFIFWTGWVSLSKWNSFIVNMSYNGLANFRAIFSSYRFQSDLRNMVYFTIGFVLLCLVVGMFLAVLLDQKIKLEGVFRSIYLYPMAVSAAATGVVWDWLLNPQTGINLILQHFGIHKLPQWYLSPRFTPSGFHLFSINGGLPVAFLAVLIATVWEWCGFTMALYLAGLRAIPEEIKEAAVIDGAGPWRTFFSVILPQLRSVTVTAIILLMASSLKVFDLLYAMTGPGPNFITDLPALNMFDTTFNADAFAQGAAIAIVLLVLVLIFVVPYLISTLRREARG